MPDISSDIHNLYANVLRVRVCGLCLHDHKLLLINHRGLGNGDIFWAPPGGGMIFGNSAEENLIREYKEETGLDVIIKNFLFVNEYIGNPLHAIELFFEVEIVGGSLIKGSDPEMKPESQIIKDVVYMSWDDLKKYKKSQFHNIFSYCSDFKEIFNLKGYFKFENNYIK